ncbi:phosphatase PAP2 family protein [Alteromonas stellipolaris]|uniref:undecaprenyl-diphosphate phosphatase n=1 Tax=Alteromonas stellipolaris TaxID=233316 RepID=A0ABN4LV30_9ALTE|nr:phosphoesterase PA-phosphatase [Alteromonas stellipolaris]
MSTRFATVAVNTKFKTTNWVAIFAFLIVVLVLFSIALDKNAYLASQTVLFSMGNQALQILPEIFWHNVTYLGDALVLIPLLSFICLFNKRAWAAMFGAIPLACILSHAGKNFFAIPRPAAILDLEQFTIIGSTLTAHSSFPSGHTITIFTTLSAIWFVTVNVDNKRDYSKFILTTLLCLVASITAISRVAVGAHWPADLIFGAVLGIVAGFSGEYLTRRYSGWWHWVKEKPLYLGYFVLFFCGVLLFSAVNGKVPQLAIVWAAIIVSTIVGTYIALKASLNK